MNCCCYNCEGTGKAYDPCSVNGIKCPVCKSVVGDTM